MFLSIGMLKQKYFLADIFILSAEKQPIKLSWRKIECLLKYDKSEVVTNIRELTSKTIRWLYFRKRQPAFGRTIEQIIV